MIDVARIDYWAANGSGPLHRTSTISKLLFVSFAVAAAVVATDPYPLLLGYAFFVFVAAVAKLPWYRMLVFSLYASLFPLLYGISMHADTWMFALLIAKAITPAFAVLTLIMSTPYPRIFSLLGVILPDLVAAALFMTYRSVFVLLDMMDNFIRAIRLRGGFSPGSLAQNSANIANGIGMLFVRAVEHASRLYAVMVVRGFSGSMAERETARFTRHDWIPVGAGTAVLILVIAWN